MSDHGGDDGLRVKRVRRAYEQVADQLRDLIISGTLSVGDRLPTEAELCERFQTSRSTIREALRLLSSQSLITTQVGATGGSSVAHPQITEISDFLNTTLSLLAGTSELSVREFLEARQLLEVPAARMATQARGAELADTLKNFAPTRLDKLPPQEIFRLNRQFHLTIVESSGNRLLRLMAEPLFSVMQNRFLRDRAHAGTWEDVERDHQHIIEMVQSGDADAVEEAMRKHLGNLEPLYSVIDSAVVGG
jgi:GntR family transcriptional regulator, transcriptional repressor for pyruvate dehydrogenase complex